MMSNVKDIDTCAIHENNLLKNK
uniref:Uncharacterized protein n=1 Tax=Arundo donax TaxID=35708 RepID=A0A0A8Y2K2_ARUDO